MEINLKRFIKAKNARKITILASSIAIVFSFFGVLIVKYHLQNVNAELEKPVLNAEKLAMFQENSLVPVSSPKNPDPRVKSKISALITAYSSTPWQTDEDPFITAAGTPVRDGVIANNLLPFGTKVRIPELYGDKIFVVEDRMSKKKWNYHFDIWFSETQAAKNFGAKETYIEILGS